MPGVAWMAHSFFNATDGAVFDLNVTRHMDDNVAQLARHGYLASVSWFDHQVGRILAELEQLGLTNDTVVVVHGDHGWQLGEHNSWHKYTNFELGTRVPLIFRAPFLHGNSSGDSSSNNGGLVTNGLAELIDVFPTLADITGTPPPTDALDGVSLKPFFLDPTRESFPTTFSSGTDNKTLAFSQYPHSANSLTPATRCPFYQASNNSCTAQPVTAARNGTKGDIDTNPPSEDWMGFSVRDKSWRYTAWIPYNGR